MSFNTNQTEVSSTEDTIKRAALPPPEYGVVIKQKTFLQTLPERIPAFGLLCCLLSEIVFSLASLIVKVLTGLHSVEVLVFRALVQIIPFTIIIIKGKHPFFGVPGHRIQLAIRCISGTISLICQYMSYRLMPLSDASSIFMSSPVFVTILAYFILKEPITIIHVVTGVLTVVGVFIIAKPEFLFGHDEVDDIYDQRLLGIILSAVAAICGAYTMINLRQLKTTPVSVVVMWFSLATIIGGTIVVPILDKWVLPSDAYTWLMLLAIGVAGTLHQLLLTTALKYESAGPISVARSFSIVLAFVWELAIFHEPVEWTSILGACMVTSCVVMIALYKFYKENPEKFREFFKNKISFLCNKKGEQNLDSRFWS